MTDQPQKLVEPPESDPVASAIEHCELMIEEGIEAVLAIREDKPVPNPSFKGQDFDEGYAQGRKDACRVILMSLRGREHVNSVDVEIDRKMQREQERRT